MSRNAGMGILRLVAVIGGASILFFLVLTAVPAFMPGTKIGHLFGASAPSSAPDAGPGTGADGGSMATSPGGQGGSAPTEAQALPAQQRP
jgi:amino acid transporter